MSQFRVGGPLGRRSSGTDRLLGNRVLGIRVSGIRVSLAISLALVSLLVACRRETKPPPQDLPHSSSNDELGALRHESGARQLVSLGEDWQTEAFNNHAGSQLKRIGKLAMKGHATAEELAPYLAEGFRCQSLRPTDLAQVYSDEATTVLRGANLSASTTEFHNAEGLEQALAELLEPLAASSPEDRRIALKIIRVEPHDENVETQVRIEVFGRATEGSVQQVATWRCRWQRSQAGEKPQLEGIEVEDFEEVVVHGPYPTLFADCTPAVLGGNACYEEQLLPGTREWRGWLDASLTVNTFGFHGVAVGDVNGDGLEDLYVCQTGGLPNRLFLQQDDGTAKEVSREWQVNWLEPSYGVLLVDLDNDGDQDLVMSTLDRLMFLANEGDHFEHACSVSHSLAYTLTAADYDGDGNLDIYTCVYYGEDRQPGQLAYPVPYHDARNGGRNILWQNEIDGDEWQFIDATADAGLEHNNDRWSLGASWEDYDLDGDLDLYVSNDFGRNNLYQNNSGHFYDVAEEAGVEDGAFGMSVAWGDFNRDGWPDLYVSNMFSSAGNRVTYQRNFRGNDEEGTRAKFQYLARGNSLFQNTGKGTFEDVSAASGTMMGRWAWASRFIDINNDGWQDLLCTNGYLTNELKDDL